MGTPFEGTNQQYPECKPRHTVQKEVCCFRGPKETQDNRGEVQNATLRAMLERLFARHLEDDEPLTLVIHKHWLLGLKELVLPITILLSTWALLFLAPIAPIAWAILLADSAILVWLLHNFLDYFLDAWLVTDRSVIDVAWHGFLHRSSTRIDYSSIEGVSYEVKGFLGTLFRFGTVTIEKVGTGTLVSIEHVGNPRAVESAILLCQEQCLRTKNLKDSKAVQEILSQIVAERSHLEGGRQRDKFETRKI